MTKHSSLKMPIHRRCKLKERGINMAEESHRGERKRSVEIEAEEGGRYWREE